MEKQLDHVEKDSTTDEEESCCSQESDLKRDFDNFASQLDDGGEIGELNEEEAESDEQEPRWSGNIELGRRGEEAAARYLELHGYDILERNWVCKFGEADIIAQDPHDGAICFIEVKTRRNIDKGIPEEAITKKKQDKYERIALSYLMEADWDELPVRFDAIGICATEANRALLRHHKACFNGRW